MKRTCRKMDAFQKGVTLIELMVTVAIIGIISAIALPQYTEYVDTSKRAVLLDNMQTIRLFEEEARLSGGVYIAGTYDPSDVNDSAGLKTLIGWEPRTATDEITYVVDSVTITSFQVTATMNDGTEEQRTFSR